MKPVVKRFPDLKQLSIATADLMLALAEKSVAERGSFMLAISGGNTPLTLFETLASFSYKQKMPWEKIQLFWVDERCVSEEHPDNNFNTAFAAFISKVSLLTKNVRPILTSLASARETAGMYERLARSVFNMKDKEEAFPEFDLILLGVGTDGHTASLFPGSQVLNEKRKWFTAVPAPAVEPSVERVTMTLPVINNAKNVAFLVSGKGKKDVVEAIVAAKGTEAEKYPAALVKPAGNLYWFLDSSCI